MEPLDFGFWELLAVEPVLLPDGEMDSDLTLVEVDVREGSCSRWSGIQTQSELADEHLAVLAVADPVIERLKPGREVIGWEDPPVFHDHLERLADADREVVPRVGIDEAFSVHLREVDGFGENFTNREGSSLVLCLGIIARVPENPVGLTENEFGAVGRDEFRFLGLRKELRENLEKSDVFGGAILDTVDEGIELLFPDIGEMVVFYDMDSDIEELEAYPEVREPEVG